MRDHIEAENVDRKTEAGDVVGRAGRCVTPWKQSQGGMSIVAGLAHLSGVVGPAVAMGLQHEADDIGDSGDLGTLGVRSPFDPVAFGKLFRCDLF